MTRQTNKQTNKPSRAEQMRRHREIFAYARAHNLTLIAAEKALVHAEWRAAQERLARLRACGTAVQPEWIGSDYGTEKSDEKVERKGPPPPDAPWMMRD